MGMEVRGSKSKQRSAAGVVASNSCAKRAGQHCVLGAPPRFVFFSLVLDEGAGAANAPKPA